MRTADKITSLRIILAPFFFGLYCFPFRDMPSLAWLEPWSVPALWLIFIVSELTDMFDGMAARKLGEVSDFGKLFDPFADTLAQLTFFLCFVLDRTLPAILFLLVLYREFSILFVRNLMLRKGIALGARMGGKIKTVAYIGACALALLASSFKRFGLAGLVPVLSLAAISVFALSVVLAVLSFIDYIKVYTAS